jgi:hypothetical protein
MNQTKRPLSRRGLFWSCTIRQRAVSSSVPNVEDGRSLANLSDSSRASLASGHVEASCVTARLSDHGKRWGLGTGSRYARKRKEQEQAMMERCDAA